MTTLPRTHLPQPSRRLAAGLKAFADEAFMLVDALLNPRPLIAEVERMHALHRQACAVEAADPMRAAMLRRKAARIGLR